MLRSLRNPKFYLIVCIDVFLFAAALAGAYWVRFDFAPWDYFEQFMTVLPFMVICKSVMFWVFSLYKGMWRYSDIRDFWRLAQATVLAEILAVSILAFLFRFEGYSRGVFVIDAVLTFVFAGGARVSIRTYFTKRGTLAGQNSSELQLRRRSKDLTRCVILGAGSTGEKILREMIENPQLTYQTLGFLDDDSSKVGRSLHGVPVLGGIDGLDQVVRTKQVQEVLIAMPSANGEQMRRVVTLCEQAGVGFKTMPGIGELIEGNVSISQFREVNLQDLLGRKQVVLDCEKISSYIHNKVVLITGAGGSIGSELVRQVVRFQPQTVVLLDRAESSLYAVQMELKHELEFHEYVTVLGRVQDAAVVDRVFAQYRPQVVFHAAAYKHVPMIERNPWEAVFNNVLGSKVVMEAAAGWRAERFVLVSTDKAVRPTNVMGVSKRVTELIMQAMPREHTRFMAVRFGNVLGSAGSVIPLFQRQIKRGGPVTVTHPEMTRYFMTIPEACQLIVQAGGMGDGGEIYILKMGEPVRIADMARDLIRLSGREPDVDIQIEYTGVRSGEKLYEELITQGEGVVETGHKDIMVLSMNTFEASSGQCRHVADHLPQLITKANSLDGDGIKTSFKGLVPEYTISESEYVVSKIPQCTSRVLSMEDTCIRQAAEINSTASAFYGP
jgi:FlaA1/EpsC-like NDP-sugar epimerase